MDAKTIFYAGIRYLGIIPQNLFGWLAVAIVHALWGRRLFWWGGALVTILKNDSWPMKKDKFGGGWFLRKYISEDGTVSYHPWGGVNLTGFAIILSDAGANTSVMQHELQHGRQGVARGIGFILLLIPIMIINWWVGLLMWLLFDLASAAGIRLEAVTNRTRGYEDNISEEHARAMQAGTPWHRIDDVLDGKVEYAVPRGPFTTTS